MIDSSTLLLWSDATGLTLLHFLWQGIAVGALDSVVRADPDRFAHLPVVAGRLL